MRCSLVLVGILFFASPLCSAEGSPDVVFRIAPDTDRSSDFVTICRVTASNYTGASLDGGRLGFEALALENGSVVERERGRFGGIIRNGDTAETLIGFNGVFRSFDVASSPVSSRARSGGGSRRGGKSSSGKAPKKTSTGKKKKKAN